MSKKQPRQQKSRMYYYFWSIATVSVVLGQLYVGTGYRIMSQNTHKLTDLLYNALEYPEQPYDLYNPL